MTSEQHLQAVIAQLQGLLGAKDVQAASLQIQLNEALQELATLKPKETDARNP